MGGRRSKYERKKIRVTEEWYKNFCEYRIQPRDRKIFKFLSSFRIATSKQISRLFWRGRSQARKLCNDRLRILFDLHCVDRFFPPVEAGSSLQHLVLDYAGAKSLNLDKFYKRNKLPYSYKHMTLVSEFAIQAHKKGLNWEEGKVECDVGGRVADIYYDKYNIAVEIDTGTESHSDLKEKGLGYNRISNRLEFILFITNSNKKRVKKFLGKIRKSTVKHKAGCIFDDLSELLPKVRKSVRRD